MTWMNEHEIQDVVARYQGDSPVGLAVLTLQQLVNWTNSNSDGWPYWQPPAKAADRLMDLIQQHDRWHRRSALHLPHAEATPEAVKLALRPVKAFRTRHGADFPIFETVADIEAAEQRRVAAVEAAERAELARLKEKYEHA